MRTSCDRTGYRPERRATGGPCFRAKTRPVARFVRPPAKLRFRGASLTRRFSPASRFRQGPGVPTGESSRRPERIRRDQNLADERFDRQNSSLGRMRIASVSIAHVPAQNPGDFWPAAIFFQSARQDAKTQRKKRGSGNGKRVSRDAQRSAYSSHQHRRHSLTSSANALRCASRLTDLIAFTSAAADGSSR